MKFSVSSLLLLFFLSFHSVFSQDELRKVNSEIKSVLLFRQGARVCRSASLSLNAGVSKVVFAGVSPKLNVSSIQVKLPENVKILSINFRKNTSSDVTALSQIPQMIKEINKMSKKLTSKRNKLSFYRKEEAVLKENLHLKSTTAESNPRKFKRFINSQRSLYLENLEMQEQLQSVISSTDSIYQIRLMEISRIQRRFSREMGEIEVAFQSESSVATDVLIDYYVDQANWSPIYDFNVENISSPFKITSKARISQQTEEDWNNVHIQLSMIDENQSVINQELKPWQISKMSENAKARCLEQNLTGIQVISEAAEFIKSSVVSGEVYDIENEMPLAGVTVRSLDNDYVTVSDSKGTFTLPINKKGTGYVLSLPGYRSYVSGNTSNSLSIAMINENVTIQKANDLGYFTNRSKEVTIRCRGIMSDQESKIYNELSAIRDQEISFKFEIKEPVTVLSGYNEQTVNLSQMEIPATYRYYSIPKLEKAAYLRAEILDWQNYSLLSGTVNLYFEGSYLGEARFNLEQVSDTLFVSLGRDKNVIIDRVKRKDFIEKQFLGPNKIKQVGFDISVKNNKREAIDIVILDQFPTSTESDVVVENAKAEDAKIAPDSKEIRWELKVEPQTEVTKRTQYTVKSPKSSRVMLE